MFAKTSVLFNRVTSMETRPTFGGSIIAFILTCGLWMVGTGLASPPALAVGIVVTDPITNEVGVDLNANIVATYTAAISPTTVTTRTFVAQGMMSGAISGTLGISNGDTVVTLDPDGGYFPGEVVRVSATGGISDTGGLPVTPYQWQFTAGPVFPRCAGEFSNIGVGLTGVQDSSVAWGDYDNDGDLDILLTGYNGSGPIAQVWHNNGGSFTLATSLTGVEKGSVAWGDYDNDGDLDILLTGYNNNSTPITQVWRNDGDGAFTQITTSLMGVAYSSAAWGDYDNDGDLDILLTGYTADDFLTSQVWRNDEGTFVQMMTNLVGVYRGSADWGDYDNDGDLDILLTGNTGSAPTTKLYRNDGGTFADTWVGLTAVRYGRSAGWGDYDNDGDLDILLAGRSDSGGIAQVWRNDRVSFILAVSLTGVYYSSVAWGDYDNDGDLDILLTGNSSSGQIAQVWRNNGGGTFAQITTSLPGVQDSSVAWGDYDNDGDLDILLTGQTSGFANIAQVWRNEDCPELHITKQVTPEAEVDYHGVVTYTVVLSNTGGVATNVRLTDTLPADVEFADWVERNGAVRNGETITWTGTVTAGVALTWTWQAAHTGDSGGVVTNTVQYGYNGATEGYTATFEVKGPPVLILSKEVTPTTEVDYHGVVTYSVVLTNLGEANAEGTLLTDTLPAEVDFGSWLDDSYGATVTGDEIRWTGVVSGNMGQIIWMWTVTHTGDYSDVVTNVITATHPVSAQTVEDDAVFTVKTAPNLTVTKMAVPEMDVDYHGPLAYTVVLYNTGESDADGVMMTDTLPSEVKFNDWLLQNGASESGGEITWTGVVTASEGIGWSWLVTHTGSYGEVVTNTVEYVFSLGSGSAGATFQVKAMPSLTITKSVSPASDVDEGNPVTYTVMLQNTSGTDAIGVVMTDVLPSRVEFTNWVGEDHGATELDGAIAWTGDVSAGATLTWTWMATFTGGFGAVDNTAWYSHTVASVGSATATFTLEIKLHYLPVVLKQSH